VIVERFKDAKVDCKDSLILYLMLLSE